MTKFPKIQIVLYGLMKLFVGRTMNIFANFLILAVLSRLLGKEVFGAYLTLFSFAFFASHLSRFGLEQLSMSMAHESIGSRKNIVKLARHFLPIFLFGQVLVVLFYACIHAVPQYRTLLVDPQTVIAIFVFVILFAFQNILGEFFRAKRSFLFASLSKGSVLNFCALIIIGGYAILLGPEPMLLSSIWVIMMIAAVVSSLMLLWVFWRDIKTGEISGDYAIYRGSFGQSARFTLSSLMTFLLGQSDIWISAFLFGPEATAEYAVAGRIILLTTFAASLINGFIIPDLNKFKSSEDRKTFEKILRGGSFVNFFIGLIVSCVLFIFAEPILLVIFGSNYTSAVTILRILLIGQISSVLVGPVGYALVVLGHTRYLLICSAIGLTASILLFFLMSALFRADSIYLACAFAFGNFAFQAGMYIALRLQRISAFPSYSSFKESFVV